MKSKLLYLMKGMFFSVLILAALILILAGLMYKAGLSEKIMLPLVIAAYMLSVFVGGLYFAKHKEHKRFLQGILFGAAFYILYLIVLACTGSFAALALSEAITMLVFSLVAGMVGGMVS